MSSFTLFGFSRNLDGSLLAIPLCIINAPGFAQAAELISCRILTGSEVIDEGTLARHMAMPVLPTDVKRATQLLVEASKRSFGGSETAYVLRFPDYAAYALALLPTIG